MRFLRFGLIALVALTACKQREEAPAAPAPKTVASTSASSSGPGFDVQAAKVALPETQGTPEKKTADFGGHEVTIEVCSLDTALPPMTDSSWDRALPSMTVAADGTLYVLDPQNKIRHYVNRASRGCELVLDPKFGTNGLLDLSLSNGYALAADSAGALYATSGGIGMKNKRIVLTDKTGKATDHCDGFLRLQPSSKLVVLDGRQIIDDHCKGNSVSFAGFDPNAPQWASPRVVGLYGDEIVVRGMDLENKKEVRKIGLHGTDGAQRLKLGKAEGAESMWSPDAATTCAGDLCVFDMTRGGASILRWKKDGTFVGKLRLDVVDFSGTSLAATRDSLWVAGGASAKGPGLVGVVIRVSGVQ